MVKQAKLVNLVSTVGETQKGILEMHFLPTPFFKTHFPKSPLTWVATIRNATFVPLEQETGSQYKYTASGFIPDHPGYIA